MATYIWTGAVDTNLSTVGNWSPSYPVGSPTTKVMIGHNPYYPDHTITYWPVGGHLDMEISTLYIAPSWGTQLQNGGSGDITIGSANNLLRCSKTKKVVWGGLGMFGDHCPIHPESKTYVRMEHWDDGPSTTFEIYGYVEHSAPHAPNATLVASGNPDLVMPYRTVGIDITWGANTNNIAGSTATLAQNGPKKWGSSTLTGGMGFNFTNCKINLNWQSIGAGGNPIKDIFMDCVGSTITVNADDWEDGDNTCFTGYSTFEYQNQLPEEDGNIYYLNSASDVGTESAPIAIPTLKFIGLGNQASTGFTNVNKAFIQTGITVGGQATGTGFESRFFDITFSPKANTPTVLKEGILWWRTRIDASKLAVGSFKMLNEASGEGLQVERFLVNDGGSGLMGQVSIKPPKHSNIRIA